VGLLAALCLHQGLFEGLPLGRVTPSVRPLLVERDSSLSKLGGLVGFVFLDAL
jgi:hypothetical protein